jgi:hypothetical protein
VKLCPARPGGGGWWVLQQRWPVLLEVEVGVRGVLTVGGYDGSEQW